MHLMGLVCLLHSRRRLHSGQDWCGSVRVSMQSGDSDQKIFTEIQETQMLARRTSCTKTASGRCGWGVAKLP
jgi:hypothetical protein